MRVPYLGALLAAPIVLALAPSRAQDFQPDAAVLLWIAPESFSDWESVAALLKNRADLKLTVGLAPRALPPSARDALAPLLASGRLEAALRLPGDPLLPLVARSGRPQDIRERLMGEGARYRLLFSSAPAGFVPGAGALDAALLKLLGTLGLSWAAIGDGPSNGPWTEDGGAAAVAFQPLSRAASQWAESDLPAAACAFPRPCVLDESGTVAAPGSLEAVISLLDSAQGARRTWATVSQALAGRPARASTSELAGEWPDWIGGPQSWGADPASRRAEELYGHAADALERYQNSGSANIKLLENATEALHAAQAGRYYRFAAPPAGADPAALDKEFRGHLSAVYRRVKLAPPDSLLRPMLGPPNGQTPDMEAGQPEAAPASNAVAFSQGFSTATGRSWIAFENPRDSLGRSPENGPSGDAWRISSFRVEWNGAGLTFVYRMGRLDPGEGRLILDTYLDLNGVPRAGSQRLLAGRDGFVQARDAWEYALSISGGEAFLYRANPLGPPAQAARVPVSARAETGEIRVALPEAFLKGKPSRWGFVVISLAADAEKGQARPLLPVSPPSGSAVLGLLAPLNEQEALAGGARGARLKAVRAP